MISINNVYKTVQAILNKEQRGYVAPTEFNTFAEQAQLEIFEGYFFDRSHFLTSRKGQDGTQVTNLDEKLNLFMVTNATPLGISGVGNTTTRRYSLPENLYRLCDVYYTGGTDSKIVTEISHNGSQYVRNSSKTRPSFTFPKYERIGNDIGVSPRISTREEEYSITDSNVTTFGFDGSASGITVNTQAPSEIINATSLHIADSSGDIIYSTFIVAGGSSVTGTLSFSGTTITSTSENANLDLNGATVTVSYESDLLLDYYKKPTTPVWGYVGTSNPIYSSVRSTDFDLHPSDQYVLVMKILELAGAEIKDINVVQYAAGEIQTDNANKKS